MLDLTTLSSKTKSDVTLRPPLMYRPKTRMLFLSIVPMLRMAIKKPLNAQGIQADPTMPDLETMARYKLHHTSAGFQNPWIKTQRSNTAKPASFIQHKSKWTPKQKVSAIPPMTAELAPHDFNQAQGPAICFLGHSTVWIKISGINILTDPVLGSIPPFFPRLQPVACDPRHLPQMDVILISHAHRDHLDIPSLRRIVQPKQYIVPLRCGGIIRHRIRNNIQELDWFQKSMVGDIKITCLPIQHWSKRSVRDTNKSLWASWLIESDQYKIFFAGDTAYFPYFKEIGAKFGPIDLALLPIGAFEPKWLMETVHMNPYDSVKAALDLRARKIVPIHWGTFDLGDEPIDVPPKLFRNACNEANIPEEDSPILRPGGIWRFKQGPPDRSHRYII